MWISLVEVEGFGFVKVRVTNDLVGQQCIVGDPVEVCVVTSFQHEVRAQR